MSLLEMSCLPSLPGWQSGWVLVGSASVGEGTIIDVSLDVRSPELLVDPALTKNSFALLGTL